jgi:hypothetical protein
MHFDIFKCPKGQIDPPTLTWNTDTHTYTQTYMHMVGRWNERQFPLAPHEPKDDATKFLLTLTVKFRNLILRLRHIWFSLVYRDAQIEQGNMKDNVSSFRVTSANLNEVFFLFLALTAEILFGTPVKFQQLW